MPESQDVSLAAGALRALVEHLNQPVFIKNRQLEFTFVNAPFCRLVERDPNELLGRTEAETFGGLRANENEAHDEQMLSAHEPAARLHYFSTPSGTTHLLRVHKSVLRNGSGTISELLCVLDEPGDVASNREHEEERERYARERADALKSVQEELLRKERLMVLGQLAAGLAHQIRNPLAAIANAIAIARRQTSEANQRVQEVLRIANDEIWEANRIIGDLLDFARIRPPRPAAIELGALVASALESEPLPSGVVVDSEIPTLYVLVDQRQVRDALRNLLRNAREAMNDVGTIFLRGREHGTHVELSIQDTGEGIAKEYRHLLFEPLVTSKPLGIGLGLPTARALVTSQGGTLECGEPKNGGACFIMRLPITPNPEIPNVN